MTATHPVSAWISLKNIPNWDGKSQDISQASTTAFKANDYPDCIKDLRALNIEPLSYINGLDEVSSHLVPKYHAFFKKKIWRQIINSLPSNPELWKRSIRTLRKTCGIYGIIPTSCTVSFPFSKLDRRPFALGRFSDVWRLTDERNQNLVFAVKSLRVHEQDLFEKINKT